MLTQKACFNSPVGSTSARRRRAMAMFMIAMKTRFASRPPGAPPAMLGVLHQFGAGQSGIDPDTGQTEGMLFKFGSAPAPTSARYVKKTHR